MDNLYLPLAALLLLLLIVFVKRKKIKELRHKYGNTLRDMLRIVTINFSYAQINSSLPQVLTVSWPQEYLLFLDKMNFVNMDLMGMVGIGCVEGVDYRWRVALACLVPMLLLVCSGLMYLCRQKHVNDKDPLVLHKVVNDLFDAIDVDDSGVIDVNEFQNLLVETNQATTTVEQMVQQMKQLGALGNDRHDVLLYRQAFVDAAKDKRLETALGTHWVQRIAASQARSERWSNTLILLFLMHAPVSQRLFYYFSCNQVGEKSYLVQDYSIACYDPKHSSGVPFVVCMLMFFTFGLPLAVSGLLFAKRKSLYNPKVHAMIGFLYARFQNGSEFWEIHEVVRKCLLMGFLIFLPPTSRSAVAILICVVCCCTLNYFQPHRNKLVLFVSQLSFLMSTFKYICAIFLRINAETLLKANDITILGWIMATMDVVFILVSLVVLVLIVVLLRASAEKAQQSGDTVTSKVDLGGHGQSRTIDVPALTPLEAEQKNTILALKLRQNVFSALRKKAEKTLKLTRVPSRLNHMKSIRTKKVEAIQTRHKQHRNSFVEGVLHNQSNAATRLERRLSKRKNKQLEHSTETTTPSSSVVVPVAGVANEADLFEMKYQTEMKHLAKKIDKIREKKMQKLVGCFQRVAPLDESNVANHESVVGLFLKLKVPATCCERMAKDVIGAVTVGTKATLTLEQLVGWAQKVNGSDVKGGT